MSIARNNNYHSNNSPTIAVVHTIHFQISVVGENKTIWTLLRAVGATPKQT